VRTSGDLAALLGGARERVRTARATISDWTDPDVWLEGLRRGPWADAIGDDPGAVGLPDKPTTLTSRQWLDRGADRAREERGGLVIVNDGPRWWRVLPGAAVESGEQPASALDAAETQRLWTDPQPLTRLLDLEPGDRDDLVVATARTDAYDGGLALLGYGADRWELTVDPERGVLLATVAFAGAKPFRRVEATEIAFDETFDGALFAPPPA
jgi:hypothetical protein